MPTFVAEVVEEIAFQARQDRRVDKRSGVSQRLPISVMENVLSNAERRAIVAGEAIAVPRVTDVYAALPSMTGKFELEYEGELKGAETVARELVRGAVATVAEGYLSHLDPRQVIEWFDLGGSLQLGDTMSAADVLTHARAGAGPGRSGARGRHPEARVGADARGGRRLRARGAVRDEEDQPQRRARLSRERARRCAGRRASRRSRTSRRCRRRRQEEVLQLRLVRSA